MRIAILSDIHGNSVAFEAVLADLRHTSPDLILHGGDLADGGSRPAEIVDRIRDLGWPGVLGNTDETHTRPESLDEFAGRSSAPPSLWAAVREVAAWTGAMLGEERIAWMRGLPLACIQDSFALVHATPGDPWKSPWADASDAELQSVYSPLGKPVVIYGHIHRPFVRTVGEMTVINAGSVSQSFDGDRRASYLLLDDWKPAIRRVEYDVDKEIAALMSSGLPRAEWMADILRSAGPRMPAG